MGSVKWGFGIKDQGHSYAAGVLTYGDVVMEWYLNTHSYTFKDRNGNELESVQIMWRFGRAKRLGKRLVKLNNSEYVKAMARAKEEKARTFARVVVSAAKGIK